MEGLQGRVEKLERNDGRVVTVANAMLDQRLVELIAVRSPERCGVEQSTPRFSSSRYRSAET